MTIDRQYAVASSVECCFLHLTQMHAWHFRLGWSQLPPPLAIDWWRHAGGGGIATWFGTDHLVSAELAHFACKAFTEVGAQSPARPVPRRVCLPPAGLSLSGLGLGGSPAQAEARVRSDCNVYAALELLQRNPGPFRFGPRDPTSWAARFGTVVDYFGTPGMVNRGSRGAATVTHAVRHST